MQPHMPHEHHPLVNELLESLCENSPSKEQQLEALYDIPVQVLAVLGRATIPVQRLLKLSKGSVIELDRCVGESIEIYVNNRLVARGEIVMIDDHLGVTMTEIVKNDHL